MRKIFMKNVQKKDYGNKLTGAFNSLIFSRKRLFKIVRRLAVLKFRLSSPFNKFFKNYNIQQKYLKIPQPAYCNANTDLDALRFIRTSFWTSDLSSLYTVSQLQKLKYNNFQYDNITSAYFPTKKSAMESVNLQNIWKYSYYNPKNLQTHDWQRHSDVLFADMITNTQGVYKAKRINHGSEQYYKAKKHFSKILNENKHIINAENIIQDTFEHLVKNCKLYYIDYPELRWMENDQQVRKAMGDIPKYQVNYTQSVNDKNLNWTGYLQIPFAIFAQIPNYIQKNKNSFICLGAIFNQSDQVYHPFFNATDKKGMMLRDRWQLAKSHMANTDNNYFIIRVHLGNLHYASAIYTTAFSNAAKKYQNLQWLMKEFIQVFTPGLLQINFLANLTLVDHDDPVVEKTMHLRAIQSLPIINKYNRQFKIHEFNPYIMGDQHTHQSDAIILSKKYYDNLAVYIDYLFEKYERANKLNKQSYLYFGKTIYSEVGSGKFDSVTTDLVSEDYKKVKQALKTIMKNLVYLWVVHHNETFSLVSVGSAYYFVPSFMRKPLSALSDYNKPLTNQDKQDWLAPLDIINDYMALAKQVTYRDTKQSISSFWNNLEVDPKLWNEVTNQKDVSIEHHWNQVSKLAEQINHHRLACKNLLHLHWLSPQQMPQSLNI